jgi:hypothetical protein
MSLPLCSWKSVIWRSWTYSCAHSDQLADIFTKALGINKFEEMRLKLGMVKIIRLDRIGCTTLWNL